MCDRLMYPHQRLSTYHELKDVHYVPQSNRDKSSAAFAHGAHRAAVLRRNELGTRGQSRASGSRPSTVLHVPLGKPSATRYAVRRN
jgi:hypothetical protein